MAGKSKRIVQLLAADSELHVHREAKLLGRLFRDWGWEEKMYLFDGPDSDESKKPLRLRKQDRMVVHYTGSPVPEAVAEHPTDQIILILHDYVPAAYHHLYSDNFRKQLIRANEQLRVISGGAVACIGHSEKAVAILEQLGAARVRHVSLLFDFSAVNEADDAFTTAQFRSEFKRVLFSGEVDGESGLEDLLKTFWYFRSFVDKKTGNWQLFSMGRYDRCEGAMLPIHLAIKHYEIPQGWMEMAPDLEKPQLDTAFRYAAIYASFDRGDLDGAGLIQAIASGIPAFAVAQGAGSTVLGDSPLVFDEPFHSAVAESMNRVLLDTRWRDKILAQQRGRLEQFEHTAVAFTLKSIFARL